MDHQSDLSQQIPDNGLFHLLDKYLKASDNYLPLKAYLESLEYDSNDEFNLISNVKLIGGTASSENSTTSVQVRKSFLIYLMLKRTYFMLNRFGQLSFKTYMVVSRTFKIHKYFQILLLN